MSTATTTKARTAKKSTTPAITPTTNPAGERPNLVELRAAVFAALAKVAEGEGDRDEMADGGRHEFSLTVSGEIDGYEFGQSFAGHLSVGHASDRASSTGPNQDHLLAYVLSKLNTVTRDAIFRDTAAEFAAAGNELPAVDDAAMSAARDFRAGLRQKVTQHVRGSVHVEYVAQAGQATLRFSKVG
jgi:hypothetical protein